MIKVAGTVARWLQEFPVLRRASSSSLTRVILVSDCSTRKLQASDPSRQGRMVEFSETCLTYEDPIPKPLHARVWRGYRA